MIRVELDEAQQQELERRTRAADITPRTRDRLEMVRLSANGWSVPQIAAHLRRCQRVVRHWLKAFQQGGFDALPDRPHPGRKSQITPEVEEAIRQKLREGERTWTAAQLGEWLEAAHAVHLSLDHLGRRLKQARITYRRTTRSVKHKQKPDEVAAKQKEMAAQEKRGTKARSTSPTSTRSASP